MLGIAENVSNLSGLPEMLTQLLGILRLANKNIKEVEFNKYKICYDSISEKLNVYLQNSKIAIPIQKASSGLQSVFPILFVTKYLRDLINLNVLQKIKSLNENNRNIVINSINDKSLKNKLENYIFSGIESEFTKQDLVLLVELLKKVLNFRLVEIVEEPEQNLYPESQVNLLKFLVTNTFNKDDKLILTTHSPYILSEINNYILAKEQFDKTGKSIKEINDKLFLSFDDVSAYKIENGTVKSIMEKEFNDINILTY